MPHSIQKLVEDALTGCAELRHFTAGKSYEDLVNDRGLQLIIERLFEVIGEALYRLRNLDESTFDQIQNGHRIIGTRNLLAHGYDIVDHEILWVAATTVAKPRQSRTNVSAILNFNQPFRSTIKQIRQGKLQRKRHDPIWSLSRHSAKPSDSKLWWNRVLSPLFSL